MKAWALACGNALPVEATLSKLNGQEYASSSWPNPLGTGCAYFYWSLCC